MKRPSFLFPIIILCFLLSCRSAEKHIGSISADYCDCLKMLTDKMSADTRTVIINAADAGNPSSVIQSELAALGEERGSRVIEQMKGLRVSKEENPIVNECLDDVGRKYSDVYDLNEAKTLQMIVRELEGKPGCILTAAVLKMGLKRRNQQGK